MVIGQVITSCISFFINAYMPGKMFGYGAFKQLKDMIPVFIAIGVMALLVFTVNSFIEILWLQLIVGGIVGIASYLLVCYLLKLEELKEVGKLISNFKNRR